MISSEKTCSRYNSDETLRQAQDDIGITRTDSVLVTIGFQTTGLLY